MPARPLACVVLLACAAAAAADDHVVLQDFSGPEVPLNGDGDTYPSEYGGIGAAAVSLGTPSDAVSGACVQFALTSGQCYPQFNPYNYAANPAYPAGPRAFARDYAVGKAGWAFDRYDRMRFWIKLPPEAAPMHLDGRSTMEFGTYVKRVTNPDGTSDEAGGNHYYHILNIGPTGAWTQVILNMHPDHRRGDSGNDDLGELRYPTGEDGLGGNPGPYDYFDCLTRFYIQVLDSPTAYPATYQLDQFEVYREAAAEPEREILSRSATWVPATHRLILTWSRAKDDNTVVHHVRYAFSDIHAGGWDSATPAPGGDITPPGWQGYNGMVYDTTAIDVTGHRLLYVAIRPDTTATFAQIVVPLDGAAPTTTNGGGSTGGAGGTAGGSSSPSASDDGSTRCGFGGGLAAALALLTVAVQRRVIWPARRADLRARG